MKHFSHRSRHHSPAFTLLELIIVVCIIGLLSALMVPGFSRVREFAEASNNLSNLRQIAVATISWSTDHGGKLPSPEYPGGMEVPSGADPDQFFPRYWDAGDSGLWLDGVIFGAMYLEEAAVRAEEEGDTVTDNYRVDSNGSHIKGTVFENTQSVRKNPLETDYHKHSYAMNANLRYDRIYDQISTSDPYLTEKTVSNLIFMSNALLYIECTEPNVIMYDDRDDIIETFKYRWSGGKGLAAFLDGSAARLTARDIPHEDPYTDQLSSRFWRGVDPSR